MFRIRQFEARTLSWWYEQRDLTDFSPPYQRRGGVWSAGAKAYLVDTILNDFDVPKFYVADFSYSDSPLSDGQHQYAVIDGKQRFEAIFDFIQGKIQLAPDFTMTSDASAELGGLSYRDLTRAYPKVAAKFDNFNLSVMSVITDDEAKINDLFIRLNSSSALSAPELRNAMAGVAPSVIRSIADHEFFTRCVKFKTNRGQDRQAAAKFLLTEFSGALVDTKKADLDSLVQTAAKTESAEIELTRSAARVARVLDQMTAVFSSADPLLSSQGPLVVYYWIIRQIGADKELRPFLLQFESARAANRQAAKSVTGGRSLDAELLQFDALNRSINDESSLRGRVNILLARWRLARG